MGRILAVDPGSKRVGLALSDPLQILASPFATIPFVSMKKLAQRLRELVREKDIETVIIGLPVREDGTEGPGCAAARDLAGRLEKSGVQLVLWNEQYTSCQAEELLSGAGVRAHQRKGKVDSLAASFILKSYLESQTPHS